MSLEQLRASLAKTKNDQTIQDKLKSAKPPENFVSIAKKHGHELTADRIGQLIEEELEGMAGGARGTLLTITTEPAKHCY